MIPPTRLSERGPLRALYAWLNSLRDYVVSLTPQPSDTVKPNHTSMGTTYTAAKKGPAAESDDSPRVAKWG